MKDREQKKGIAVNTLYTMGGLLWMNAVLQIVVTPLLNRLMGAEQLGNLLYITGLVAIICPSVGQALNTSRLVVRRDCEVTNGDYDWLLLIFGAIGSVAALVMSRNSITNMAMAVGVFIMFMLTVFRYYGDVEYRLNLNYRRYFIYEKRKNACAGTGTPGAAAKPPLSAYIINNRNPNIGFPCIFAAVMIK